MNETQDNTIRCNQPTASDIRRAMEVMLDHSNLMEALRNQRSFLREFEDTLIRLAKKDDEVFQRLLSSMEPMVLIADHNTVDGVITAWTFGALYGYLLREQALIREMNEAMKL